MLARTNGNLAQVYFDYARQSAAAMTERARITKNLEAEIGEGAGADWYLVYTYPGDDLRAMRWLARRRFGVFRPMQQRTWRRNESVKLQGWEPAFPGWLFVFVWDMNKLKDRVRTCPGVMGLLYDPVSNKPLPIPDEFVIALRAKSWVYDDRAAHSYAHSYVSGQRHRKRRPRPGKRIRKAMKDGAAILSQPVWETANTLAPDQRITLLQTSVAPLPQTVAGAQHSGTGGG